MCLHCRRLTTDRAPQSVHTAFQKARRAESGYAARLRKIARHVADIVGMFDPNEARAALLIRSALERYAQAIDPWAQSAARLMVAEVAKRDEASWNEVAAKMGRAIGSEIRSAPTGEVMRRLMAEQVTLIKSLPLEAAQRVHDLAIKGIETGMRADQIAQEIMRTGEVTRSRANLIARTEVGRAATTLTQARAEHIGSTGYLWRTAKDSDVRKSHRAMAGTFVEWDKPPTLDNLTGHAGALPNCRCYCEPVIPDD